MREKTFSLKFVLRKQFKNTSETFPIYLRYSFQRKSKNIPLGENIQEKHFVESNGTLGSKCPNSVVLSKKMNDLRNKFETIVLEYFEKNDIYPDTEDIEKLITDYDKKSKVISRKSVKKLKSIEDLFNNFLKEKEKEHIKSSTFTTYNQFWNNWKGFEDTTKSYKLEDLNKDVFNKFDTYLLNKNLQPNSIGKQMKILKNFLNYVYSVEKEKISTDYQKIKVKKENNDFIVLNELEVEKLSSFVLYSKVFNHPSKDLDLTPSERYIGRIFLFLCSTGLSYVDFNRLTIDNIFITENKDLKVKFVNIKITRKKLNSTIDCTIPIIGKTIDLLFVMLGYTYFGKDYDRKKPFYESLNNVEMLMGSINSIRNSINNNLGDISKEDKKQYPRIFPKISDQKFNKKIKEVLKKIGIDERIKINKKIKNNVKENYHEKWSLVSSHTGRRTYVTWCISKGIDKFYIMSTTGHTNTQTLHRYTKVEEKNINLEFYRKITENETLLNQQVNKKPDEESED